MIPPPAELVRFLVDAGLASSQSPGEWTPLAGGVSSDVWKVETANRGVVIKRALSKLKVAADWTASTSRNAYEWAWMVQMSTVLPEAVPEPLAHDSDLGLFAMAYLPPADYLDWKAELLAGRVDAAAAGAVGAALAALHQGTARRPDLLAAFDTTDLFHDLRLSPYLLYTATAHPDLAPAIQRLAVLTAAQRLCLVHGDVSPKNILIGPHGPVFLDAECAWYGDPAFDLAFCLNHLLLKSLLPAASRPALRASFDLLAERYLAGVTWEEPAAIERRAAELLPALMLARVDGKSPVEYLTDAAAKDRVRNAARSLLLSRPSRLAEVADALPL